MITRRQAGASAFASPALPSCAMTDWYTPGGIAR